MVKVMMSSGTGSYKSCLGANNLVRTSFQPTYILNGRVLYREPNFSLTIRVIGVYAMSTAPGVLSWTPAGLSARHRVPDG